MSPRLATAPSPLYRCSGSTANAPPLRAAPGQKYPVIRTKPSLSARLENVLSTALAKLDTTSNSINALLSSENLASVKSTLANLAEVTQALAASKEKMNAGIANAARTFDHTARATTELGPVIERIGRSADALEKMGNEAAAASATAGKTVDSVGAEMKRFTADALPEVQRLLGEMSVLAASLRRLSEKIEGSPGGLLLGRRPVPPGPGEKETK
jgi:phospholipid/cholesterol/gamma-HCH transport system substrate-binding protein